MSVLYIQVEEARSLTPSDLNGWADPLAEVYIDEKKLGSTNYITKTLNPAWGQFFKKKGVTNSSHLQVKVWDHDTLMSNSLLGCIDIELSFLKKQKWCDRWYRFKDPKLGINVRGYVRIKLQLVDDGRMPFDKADHDDTLEKEDRANKEREKTRATNERQKLTETNRGRSFGYKDPGNIQTYPLSSTQQDQQPNIVKTERNKKDKRAAMINQQQTQGFQQPPVVPGHQQTIQMPGYQQPANIPVYQQAPQMPGYQQAPTHPGYQQAPTHPGFQQAPPVPVYQQAPPMPGYQQAPPMPGYQQAPMMPGYQQAPMMPGYR